MMHASPRPPFPTSASVTEGARDAQQEDRRQSSTVSDLAMLKFDWNALRIGDRVLVHDANSPQLTLLPGIVTVIDARRGAKRAGVRFSGIDDQHGIRWPSYPTMHRDPRGPADHCWRCDDGAEAPHDRDAQEPDGAMNGAHA